MRHCATLRHLAIVLGVVLLHTVPLSQLLAQKSYRLTVPVTDTTLATRGYHDFLITMTNRTGGPVTFYLSRVENGLPSNDWYTYLCTRDLCFLPSRDSADPVVAGPGESVPYKFSVNCGSTPGETGYFTLVVGDGTYYDTLNFSVTVGQGAGVDGDARVATGAWPSPTGGQITLATPARSGLTVYIFSASGELELRSVTTGETSLPVAVNRLAPGRYFYCIGDGPTEQCGSFVVAR